MDKVAHFELPVDNVERAKKFYRETFNWQTEDLPEKNYIIIKTGGEIDGEMLKRDYAKNIPNYPTITVNVDDIEMSIKKIKNAGGLILKDKTQVADLGFMAYFRDSEGNILSIWQNQPLKKPEDIIDQALED